MSKTAPLRCVFSVGDFFVLLIAAAGFLFTGNIERSHFQQIIYANLPHLALHAIFFVFAGGERARHLDLFAFFECGGFLAFLFPTQATMPFRLAVLPLAGLLVLV